MGKKLYVANVSSRATEEDLRALFAEIGEVASINLITDARTGKVKGFAFVEMASEEGAQKAIESLHGTLLLNKPLSISEAFSQQPRERRDLDAASGRRGRK